MTWPRLPRERPQPCKPCSPKNRGSADRSDNPRGGREAGRCADGYTVVGEPLRAIAARTDRKEVIEEDMVLLGVVKLEHPICVLTVEVFQMLRTY